MYTPQEVFELLREHRRVKLPFTEKSEVESLRVQMCKKLTQYKDRMDAIGFLGDIMRNSSVRCTVEADGTVYSLVEKRQRKQYTILEVGTADAPETQSLRTDLASDQSSAVRNGSTSPCSQEHGTDSDSLRSQGEDHVSGTDAQHWGTY